MAHIEAPSCKVLILDDQVLVSGALKLALDDAGYCSSIAATWREAAQLLDQAEFNLAICDVQMPPLHDGEMIALLRASMTRAPIIAMSADYLLRDIALRAGANLFLEKPFKRPPLLCAIRSLMGTPTLQSTAQAT